MKPAKKTLSVDLLVLDAGTQSRVKICEETVDRYVATLEEAHEAGKQNWPFPPIVVFHDGNSYLVSSGFHRTLAARRHGRASIPCEVHQGTAWDALLYGMGANKTHGLPPTRADNRNAVEILLDAPKRISQIEIARIVGVDTRTVRRIIAERKAKDDPPFDEPEVEAGIGEDETGTDSGTEDHAPPPGRTDAPGGSSQPQRTRAEEIKIIQLKTVKTAEALVRAFDDLNEAIPSPSHEDTIADCQALVRRAKNW